jgi:hypothetical protein
MKTRTSPIRALVAKELAAMRPFMLLLLILVSLTLYDIVAGRLVVSYGEMIRLGDWPWAVEGGFVLVLGFALGSGMLAREQEEGTLAFLDALPVARGTVFLTKLWLGGACVFLYAIVAPLLAWGVMLLLRRSLDVPVDAAALLPLLLRYAMLALFGVALGLLCGFTRQLSWLLLCALALPVATLQQAWPRLGSALDPTGLLAQGWATRGHEEVFWASLALTVVFAGLAYLLYAGRGGTRMQRLALLGQNRKVEIGLYCLIVALFVGFVVVSDRHDDDEPDIADSSSSPEHERHGRTRDVASAYYRFKVPPGTSFGAHELGRADRAYLYTAALLGVPVNGKATIDVDLSGSIKHTSGLASLNRIRMSMSDDWEDTLVHETMHVLAARAAGAERNRELEKMALLNEGLAHWAEPSRHRSAAQRARDELAVAVLMHRRQLSAALLLDDGAIERNLDWEMRYPLGAALIDTLVTRYGATAPLRVLRQLGEPSFPRDLSGYPLYQTAFQLAGYDLNLVMFDLAERLRALARTHAAAIEAMPRTRGMLVRRGEMVGIALAADRPLGPGQKLVLRTRPRDDSPVHLYTVRTQLDRGGALPVGWVDSERIADSQVCFQGGVASGGRVAYEPWSCLPLGAAAPHRPARPRDGSQK